MNTQQSLTPPYVCWRTLLCEIRSTGMTYAKMAKQLGITDSTLSTYRCERRRIEPRYIVGAKMVNLALSVLQDEALYNCGVLVEKKRQLRKAA